jgi:Fuc2NAc and GlcNAc transferase
MSIVFILVIVTTLSLFLTDLIRCYMVKHQILDLPNERSSHSVPVPRGGGIAIVLSFLIGLILIRESISFEWMIGLAGATFGVAVVGLLDDYGHIAIRWRLLVHFISAAWILFWSGLPSFELMGYLFGPGILTGVMAIFYLVWMLNLYNFMDGIDGIAAVEAIVVTFGAGLVYSTVHLLDGQSAVKLGNLDLVLILAAATIGFLIFNFPPAKIFLGDTGSGFLGLMLGAFSLQAAVERPIFIWCWLVLLGIFVVDSTTSLIQRILDGERIYEAHRSHAYQRAAIMFGGHRVVTLAVIGIDLIWLLPWAVMIAVDWVPGIVGLVIAYTPLVVVALLLSAGKKIDRILH